MHPGIIMMTRVRKGGLVWSAPVCSSWVAAPLVHTSLAGSRFSQSLHTHTQPCTRTHTHIHAHTHTHTHTQTHTHARADTLQDYATSVSLLFIVRGSATRTFLAILPSSVFAKVMLWLSLDLVYGCFMEFFLNEFLLREL